MAITQLVTLKNIFFLFKRVWGEIILVWEGFIGRPVCDFFVYIPERYGSYKNTNSVKGI